MHIPTFIERKGEGAELDSAEIAEFIRGYTAGTVPSQPLIEAVITVA